MNAFFPSVRSRFCTWTRRTRTLLRLLRPFCWHFTWQALKYKQRTHGTTFIITATWRIRSMRSSRRRTSTHVVRTTTFNFYLIEIVDRICYSERDRAMLGIGFSVWWDAAVPGQLNENWPIKQTIDFIARAILDNEKQIYQFCSPNFHVLCASQYTSYSLCHIGTSLWACWPDVELEASRPFGKGWIFCRWYRHWAVRCIRTGQISAWPVAG